jgi:hypothetical protein
LLEATLAVALLGALVLFSIPLVHGSRAATRHAIAAVEAAVLAEYLGSIVRTRSFEIDMTRSGPPIERTFDPPFDGFHWRIEPTDSKARVGAIVLTIYSTNARTTLVISQ